MYFKSDLGKFQQVDRMREAEGSRRASETSAARAAERRVTVSLPERGRGLPQFFQAPSLSDVQEVLARAGLEFERIGLAETAGDGAEGKR
jgi:hypothetical protein